MGIPGLRRLSRDSIHTQIEQNASQKVVWGASRERYDPKLCPKGQNTMQRYCVGDLLGWMLDFGLRSNLVNLLFIGHYI